MTAPEVTEVIEVIFRNKIIFHHLEVHKPSDSDFLFITSFFTQINSKIDDLPIWRILSRFFNKYSCDPPNRKIGDFRGDLNEKLR